MSMQITLVNGEKFSGQPLLLLDRGQFGQVNKIANFTNNFFNLKGYRADYETENTENHIYSLERIINIESKVMAL